MIPDRAYDYLAEKIREGLIFFRFFFGTSRLGALSANSIPTTESPSANSEI
ncbi:hypothetical protein IQA88_07135 [Leptospira interrogans serovar Pomona]|nr:hypothetical protein [Leptospira interrogans serovar Pomona]MBE8418258.1 hypothetical protein [Leptospira interrogans serovar Pomona]MBF3333300.1 hypothetical protein [Leptospira interrogans serovar Pomona]MBF3365169.1 hypothetical protein [Leptospira interrogans serovar Pomona]MBF3368485.1 hypothetical protein [Leptospira interrogans serovar Pomona]